MFGQTDWDEGELRGPIPRLIDLPHPDPRPGDILASLIEFGRFQSIDNRRDGHQVVLDERLQERAVFVSVNDRRKPTCAGAAGEGTGSRPGPSRVREE